MKKFLSLLLALTLVLSLVVVPARADADPVDGAQLSPATVTLKIGKTATLSVDSTYAKLTSDQSKTLTFKNVTDWASSQKDVATVADGVVTAVAVGTTNITCTANYTYIDGNNAERTVSQHLTRQVTVEAYDYVSVVKSLTYNGRTYAVTKTNDTTGTAAMCYDKGDTAEAIATAANWGVVKGTKDTATIKSVTGNLASVTVTVTTKPDGASTEQDVTITVTPSALVKPTNIDVSPASPKAQQKVTFTATASPVSKNTMYIWTIKDKDGKVVSAYSKTQSDTDANKYVLPASNTLAAGNYTITCAVAESSADKATEAFSKPFTITADKNKFVADSYNRTMTPNSKQDLSFQFYSLQDDLETKNEDINLTSTDVKWTVSNSGQIKARVERGESRKSAILRIPAGCTASTVTVNVNFIYAEKEYSYDYVISLQALSATLPTSVENGSSITLYTKSSDRHEDANLALVAQKVLRDKVSDGLRVTEATIKEARNTTTYVTGGTISKLNSSKGTYTFTADKSSLTPAEMTIVATAGGSQYEIKLTIPVTPIMGTNFESVTADPVSSTATTTSYRVYFPTTYTNYYVVNTSGSTPGSWSSSMVSGKGYNYNTPYPLSASNFNNANGTCTLYVIAKDGVNGNYYGGQMTVSLTNYDIKYSVVAGKDVTFSQKDFDSFVKEYAKNRGDWTTASRKDYPYVEFDHAELSTIPTAKTEGTLYYKGSEVTASSNRKAEYADLDRMTFEAASKPTRDTVTLRFSLVCKKYSSASDKGSTVTYPINVVISIVKEDITYTVGIDDSASVKVSDFVNFLQDAKTSYRKSTLDYVKFDVSGKNVSSYAYGGLYRSYSSYSTGKLADSTDKFYYEPSRTQYDLADVAYHTTRWAEAGKTVYIPFTVYGTKGEEASGTMAITIAQTMNFIDVKASDFFYEPVKWAVNNKITNGTSSTTFSPYKNCNRAEIVTFLWRAAGSPEPTVTRNPFKDVNAVTHSSYYKAILWASQKGITAGTTATTFSPYQECTRSQIVTFLYRYAGKPSGYYSNPFKDVSSVNEASYYNAILWAVGKGITQGTSTTTFSPYASCTRGEAVTFLYRYVNGVK